MTRGRRCPAQGASHVASTTRSTPSYLDADRRRDERDRTFHICSDCRICFKLCPSFKSLFRMIDEQGGNEVARRADARAAGPGRRRVLPVQALLRRTARTRPSRSRSGWSTSRGSCCGRSRSSSRKGKVDRQRRAARPHRPQGKVATTFAPIVNRVNRSRAGAQGDGEDDRHRQGSACCRRTRGSASRTWFRQRDRAHARRRRGARSRCSRRAWSSTRSRRSARRSSVSTSTTASRASCPTDQVCCGMPWLDAGDVDKFREHAERNVAALLPAVRAGQPVVVPQPTCAYVLKNEYPDFLGTDDARARRRATPTTRPSTSWRASRGAARHRVRRHDVRDDHLAVGVSLPGPAHRSEEPRPHGADGRQGADRRAVLGHRRHLGPAGRERRDGEARREAADGAGREVGRRARSRATASSRTRRSTKAPASSPCTRSRCWRVPTASRRREQCGS